MTSEISTSAWVYQVRRKPQITINFSIVLTSDFDYHLPAEQIAQRPLKERDASRMMVLDRSTGEIMHSQFSQFPGLLRGDELLVFNNARVIPARLLGKRVSASERASDPNAGSGPPTGIVEVFLARQRSQDTWEALVRPGKKLPIGTHIIFGDGELEAEIVERGERGLRMVRFVARHATPVIEVIERLGHVPLPPYIERSDDSYDRERYQTIFAKRAGAVAAPTAGLHFSESTIAKIREKGIETCEVTLDVGLGTFQPVRAEELNDHVIHSEAYEISEEAAAKVTAARKAGRRIVAIGTTVVRALEASSLSAAQRGGELLSPGRAEAQIFITPGYKFQVVDALLTNFHLPRSTLLALVSAFAGHANVMNAYRNAVAEGYRFYSYGDCMLLR